MYAIAYNLRNVAIGVRQNDGGQQLLLRGLSTPGQGKGGGTRRRQVVADHAGNGGRGRSVAKRNGVLSEVSCCRRGGSLAMLLPAWSGRMCRFLDSALRAPLEMTGGHAALAMTRKRAPLEMTRGHAALAMTRKRAPLEMTRGHAALQWQAAGRDDEQISRLRTACCARNDKKRYARNQRSHGFALNDKGDCKMTKLMRQRESLMTGRCFVQFIARMLICKCLSINGNLKNDPRNGINLPSSGGSIMY